MDGRLKPKIFAIAVGAVLLSSLFAAVRDMGGASDIRRQLIGTWEMTGVINAGIELPLPKLNGDIRAFRMTLHDDGNVTYGVEGNHKSTWQVADRRHFRIMHRFPPDRFPGLAGGATEDEEHEIVSLSLTRLVVRTFGADTKPFDLINKNEIVYTRVWPGLDQSSD